MLFGNDTLVYTQCAPGARDMNQLGVPNTGASSITLNPNFS